MRTHSIGTARHAAGTKLAGRVLLWMAISAAALALPLCPAAAAQADPVLARIGNHTITQQEVDDRIKVQLYDARKNAVDQMVDVYLLKRAAKKEKLSVSDYLKREVDDKVAASVNDATAKKFYDQNKEKISAFKTVPYAKLKDRIIAVLRDRASHAQREELLARLRKEAGVKILLEPPHLDVASSGHPTLGPKDAPVTVVEFGDFQCPFCGRAQVTVKAMLKQYGNRVKLVFMDFPLSFHSHAMQAANAARCADAQGKFWQYHDALFADQSKLAPADLKATAKKLKLNMSKFDVCFDKREYESGIQHDIAEGHKLDVNGTPTFFINGRQLVGAQPLSKFEEIINPELAAKSKEHAKSATAD